MEGVEPTVELSDAQPMPVVVLPIAEVVERPHVSNAPPLPAEEFPQQIVLIAPTASRRLAEILILFFSAILFLRSLAVEPFGVPTGSMAPTLIGNHKCATCPRCGYLIRVGEPGKQQGSYTKATCSNCGKTDIDLNDAMEIAGDRLLVDKNVYTLRRPRRWEPAVFRCPSDMTKPYVPYVKRVIGLPGERVQVVEGDIHINGHLARKTLVEAMEMRVPVFAMNSPPKPDGWANRWVVESHVPADGGEPRGNSTLTTEGETLRLDGGGTIRTPAWIAYKHHRFDDAAGIDREDVVRDGFVYNGPNGESGALPVHDFLVEFEVQVLSGSGALFCRLWDGGAHVIASCPVGNSTQEAQLKVEGFGNVRSLPHHPLREKKTYQVQMAFVDRRVSFAIDGRQLFPAYDLDVMRSRADVNSPVAIGVQGISVIIRDLKIYRDICYRSAGRNAIEEPLQLGPDEYFMLGDNSANSDDSRSWPIPGVPERNFLGKPFLLHQPSRITHLTIGARERIFQSIDWARIRFLR